MADSALVTLYSKAYTGNYTKNRIQYSSIKEITIHHCAGIMSVTDLAKLWQRVGRKGSSHYGVSGNQVGQYVDEKDIAWTNSNWDANCRAVTIETSNSGGAPNWPVSDSSLQTLIRLVADIAKRNGLHPLVLGKSLTWHSMYTSTACPGPYLKGKLQYICDEANKLNEGSGGTVKPISSESIVLKIYAPSGAAISAGDVVLLENISKPLGITMKSEGGALITEQAVSAGDQITIIEKAKSLGLACEENVDKTDPLSPDAVTMRIGPASSGDRAAIQKKAQELGLGYREEEECCIVGPASAGDQVLVLTLAQSLGLPYEIYKPPETSSEVEELKAQLAEMTAQRDEALKRAQMAEKNAGQYLTMIEAAKTALGV